MKNFKLAIVACALVAAVSQPAFAATDWEFSRATNWEINRSETRHIKLKQIATVFKEVTGRNSIFKNRTGVKLRNLSVELRSSVRSRLLGRLEAISDRKQARRAALLAENYQSALIGGKIFEAAEELPWDQPNYNGEDNMPEVPIPAAVWLFGSAIGFLGWKSRKPKV